MEPREFADSGLWVVTRSDISGPSERLTGIAFTHDAIVVGNEGFRDYRAKHPRLEASEFTDGRFSLIIRQGENYVARTDPLGQEVIYYYTGTDYWALSNSFWALCQVVREAGKVLTLHQPPLLAAFSRHSLFEQLVSNSTPIRQIRVLPLDSIAVIETKSRELTVRKATAATVTGSSPGDYPDALLAYAAKWAARTRGLVERHTGRVTADISGGRDSRIVLGLLLAADIDLQSIGFQSNRKLAADHAVATKLAETYGFEIRNRPAAATSVTTGDAYSLWKAGNLGVYIPVYMPRHRVPPGTLHLHGAGGGLHRNTYAHSPRKTVELARSHFANPKQHAAVAREFLSSFIEMDVDVDDPGSMNHHYMHFRSRFHFGRNWYRQLTYPLLTPLVSSDLRRIASLLPHELRAAGQLTYDLMLLLDPSLTILPFDDPGKSFRSEVVERSPFTKSRRPLRLPEEVIDYYGPSEAALPQRADRAHAINSQRAAEALLSELSELEPLAISLGFMKHDYVREAKSALESSASLAKAAKKACHVIAIGEMARLAGP